MVDVNITLAIQFVNFVIALLILNFVLIKPIRGILKKRRDIVDGLVGDTEKHSGEAAARIRRYEADLDSARASAADQRESIKQQGLDAEHGILADAQNEAQVHLQKSRREVEQEVAAAMRVLRGQVDALAGKVVAKVLE